MFVRNGQSVGSILHRDNRVEDEPVEAPAKPKAAPRAGRKATKSTSKSADAEEFSAAVGDDASV